MIRDLPDVPRETIQLLGQLEEITRAWQGRLNLVAPSTLPQFWDRHIRDSAQLIRYAVPAQRWLDLGSGSGYPGLVVAAYAREQGGQVDLVEASRKKCLYLEAAIEMLNLPATVHNIRIEHAQGRLAQPQVISARALAPLPTLLALARPWMEAGALGLFHKGRRYREELAEARRGWDFAVVEHRSITDPESVILQISDLQQKRG